MSGSREKKVRYNILSAFVCQLVALVCGLLIPRIVMKTYGSEAYGATSSITQFLAYIALLEGGIGGVARAALYKPIARKDNIEINAIVNELQSFFSKLSYAFIVYVIILACSFKYIAHVTVFDWLSTFILVIVISISTFAQYYIGISYSILLQAAQKSYINQCVMIVSTIINAILTVVLASLDCNLIIVKLVSSCIFVLRPVLLCFVAKKQYPLVIKKEVEGEIRLKQKWEGFGQHLAYYLHSNTDIVLLTMLSTLKEVTVYSVYYMVVYQMQNLISAFSSGMESLFGDMIAKKENESLLLSFRYYSNLLGIVATSLFATCSVMIVPFVQVYTTGINDVNYIRPVFSLILVSVSFIYCTRLPYHCAVYAAGRFKETRVAAYGEAIINIALSIIFINQLGIIGVAIGTLVASLFRFFYYIFYLNQHVLYFKISESLKRIINNIFAALLIYLFGRIVVEHIFKNNLLTWLVAAGITTFISFVICVALNYVTYKFETKQLIEKITKRRRVYEIRN